MNRLKLKDILAFGKHKGKTIKEILDIDAQYLVWLHQETEHQLQSNIYNKAQLGSRDSWEEEYGGFEMFWHWKD